MKAGRRVTLMACVGALAMMAGGCAGGGGGGSSVSPIPTPTPTPPTPTPNPSPLNDAEYQSSNSAVLANALAAYEAGATGAGVKVAVIDTGINPDLPEFAGRIDPASQDVAANRGIVDHEGHGSMVSGVLAANRDGIYMQGVAYNATVLSLNVYDPAGCKPGNDCFLDPAITTAIDLARTNGAKIINMSFGDEEGMTPDIWDAIQRAVDAGIVIIMAAGNEGIADPNGFALQNIANNGSSGLFVIAGSMDSNRTISSFSNRAGTTGAASWYLTALGRGNATVNEHGQHVNVSGTSFATPTIAGAAALLAGAFPNLTGAQIVEILLSSADDAGAAGTDSVFGRGILNIQAAFQPKGATSVAGTSLAMSPVHNGATSGPMGDASSRSGAGAIILDGYSRAYVVDVAKTLRRMASDRPLREGLGGQPYRTARTSVGPVAVSITLRQSMAGERIVETSPLTLNEQESRSARAVAGMMISKITPTTALALGFGHSGASLQQELSGRSGPAFLVARDPEGRAGFQPDPGSSVGLRKELGPIALSVIAERGEVSLGDPGPRTETPRYQTNSVRLETQHGIASFGLGASQLRETGTILGSRLASTLTSGGSRTSFVDGTARLDFGRGWGMGAHYRRGWTSVSASGGLVESGRLESHAFAFDVAKLGILHPGDRLAFRFAQPLRVIGGGLSLNVPVNYDYKTGATSFGQRFLGLSPRGREFRYEVAYGSGLLGGYVDLNAFMRTDAGNVEAMKRDVGAAVRFTLAR